MKKITEMNPAEFRELLHTLVNEELFKSGIVARFTKPNVSRKR